jgi:hypothetical protein
METISYKTLKFRRRFGIEIEINKSIPKAAVIQAIKNYSNHDVHSFSWGKSVNNKLWHVKHDITCGEDEEDMNGGWEIASFVGSRPQDIIHMGEVATVIKEAGAKVNRFCGLHIHAEANDLTPLNVGVMLAHWIKIEHIMRNVVAMYRSFEHCEPLCNVMQDAEGTRFRYHSYHPEKLYEYFLPFEEEEEMEDEDEVGPADPMDFRYRAINVINYYLASKDRRRKRKTIELRFPESTLNADDIIGWLRLYLNFIEYTKTATMPLDLLSCDLRTVMTYLGLGHNKDEFYLFGPSLNKTRIWFLEKLIKNLEHPSMKQKVGPSLIKEDAKKLLREIKI